LPGSSFSSPRAAWIGEKREQKREVHPRGNKLRSCTLNVQCLNDDRIVLSKTDMGRQLLENSKPSREKEDSKLAAGNNNNGSSSANESENHPKSSDLNHSTNATTQSSHVSYHFPHSLSL